MKPVIETYVPCLGLGFLSPHRLESTTTHCKGQRGFLLESRKAAIYCSGDRRNVDLSGTARVTTPDACIMGRCFGLTSAPAGISLKGKWLKAREAGWIGGDGVHI